jgi:hypothetical protein
MTSGVSGSSFGPDRPAAGAPPRGPAGGSGPAPSYGVAGNRRAFVKRAAVHRRPRARRKSRPRIRPRGPPSRPEDRRRRDHAGHRDRAATRPQRRRQTEPPVATRCPRPPPAEKLAHSSGLGQTGAVKGRLTGINMAKSAFQTMLVGGVAAGAYLASLFG